MSHLTVSYVSQTQPGIAPAGGVTAAAGAPAADNPLGFLAALIDQMLAGGAQSVAADGEAANGSSPASTLPATLASLIEAGTQPATPQAPAPADPVAELARQLDRLHATLASGESVAPDQLNQLTAAIATLDTALEQRSTANDPALDAALVGTSKPVIATEFSSTRVNKLLVDLGLIAPPLDQPASATPAAPAPAPVQAPGVDLAQRLLALSQSVAATAPALSQKLEALATKLTATKATIDASAALAANGETPPDADALTVAQIIRTLLGGSTPPTAESPAPAPSTAPGTEATDADLHRILARLGLDVATLPATNAPPAAANAAAPAPEAATAALASAPVAPTTVPAPLLRLSNQLSQVSTALADTHPGLAQKLDIVAGRIVSAGADPDLLAQLTSAATATRDPASLDRLVQSLIEGRPLPPAQAPSATAQIAATSSLPLPAPLAPKPTQSAVTEVKAALPEPASVTAGSVQDIAPARIAVAPARHDSQPAPEAKAATVIAEAAKSEPPPATNPATQPPPPPQPVAQQARALPAAYQAAANPINMGQVAFEMARQMHQGTSRFTIRLDPPELGRVDVKLHVDAAGAVNARLTVERPETLDLFQRDQRTLERALTQAGLDGSKANLEFSLRQNNQNPFSGFMGDQQQRHHSPSGNGSRFMADAAEEIAPMPAITLYRGLASAGGVNMFA